MEKNELKVGKLYILEITHIKRKVFFSYNDLIDFENAKLITFNKEFIVLETYDRVLIEHEEPHNFWIYPIKILMTDGSIWFTELHHNIDIKEL